MEIKFAYVEVERPADLTSTQQGGQHSNFDALQDTIRQKTPKDFKFHSLTFVGAVNDRLSFVISFCSSALKYTEAPSASDQKDT